ncbi:hypothetical protein OROMI_013849 [Orobanche minor]
MSDLQTECCMCGDVGFQDKLFSCTKGCKRFQHSCIRDDRNPNNLLKKPQITFVLKILIIDITFSHRYCSSNYSENAEPIEVCAWCEDQGKKSPSPSPSSSRHANNNNNKSRSGHSNEDRPAAFSSEKIKRDADEGGSSAEKTTGKAPSPRTRRYKLLKDV